MYYLYIYLNIYIHIHIYIYIHRQIIKIIKENNDNNYKNNLRKIKQGKIIKIWFKPTFGENVPTKIGRYFLNLIDQHFSQDYKFNNNFNRNNIKVSQKHQPVINLRNRKILPSIANNQSLICSWICKIDYPLQKIAQSYPMKILYVKQILDRKRLNNTCYGIQCVKFQDNIKATMLTENDVQSA